MAGDDDERPWRSRIVLPDPLPTTMAEAEEELDELREIQAHREWVVDGLREHITNVEANLERALERVSELDAHVENVETENTGYRKHVTNLEAKVAEREARLADVEAHAFKLERQYRLRGVRLSRSGIFPKSPVPRIDRIFRRGEKLLAKRPDLRDQYTQDRAVDFWYWLMWHGSRYDDEIAKDLYPQPDTLLRKRVVGEAHEASAYFRAGLVDWWTIDGALRRGGFAPERGGEVLDFGVGCGRILQFFAVYAGMCRVVGADVDPEAIAWGRENLDFAEFEVLPARPPSTFEAGRFDAIYAFSVFSHLREDVHRLWLEELHRIAKPGAALVLTVQGHNVARAILEDRWDGAFPSRRVFKKALAGLERSGFAFFPYEDLAFEDTQAHVDALGRDEYGSTFILEPYVRDNWSDLFEIVAYEESPDDWQDYVILRRR